jgi:hypothetical protein
MTLRHGPPALAHRRLRPLATGDVGATHPCASSGPQQVEEVHPHVYDEAKDENRLKAEMELTLDLERVSPMASIQTYSAMILPFCSSFRYLFSCRDVSLLMSPSSQPSSPSVPSLHALTSVLRPSAVPSMQGQMTGRP